MKTGKSKFLEHLNCRTSADSNEHTNDLSAYTFDDGAEGHDKLVLLDFPGFDDELDRNAHAFPKHRGILDAFVFVLDVMRLDATDSAYLKSALNSELPVLVCVNKMDDVLMREQPAHGKLSTASRGFQRTASPRVPRAREELEELVLIKLASKLGIDVAQLVSNRRTNPTHSAFIQFAADQRDDESGAAVKLANITIALTCFGVGSVRDDCIAHMGADQPARVLPASDVLEHWILPATEQHSNDQHAVRFSKQQCLEKIFPREEN